MRAFFGSFAVVLLAGCVTTSDPNTIARYNDLVGREGEIVTLSGYWSERHEASGIYFGRRDYGDYPEECVLVAPRPNLPDKTKLVVTGKLERSGCGDELICLTTCQPFILRATVTRK